MAGVWEQFFSLLRISAGRQEDFPVLTPEQWDRIYAIAKSHALLGVVFSAIEMLPPDVMPEKKQLIQFYAQADYIKRYNSGMASVLSDVYSRVVRDGFRCVVLKGQGAAQTYCHPEYRNPGDIDLWCKCSLGRAVEYVRGINPGAKVFYHHIDFGKVRGTEVEFHVRPTWLNSPIGNFRLQRFFDSAFDTQVANVQDYCGSPVAFPTAEFNLVFMPVHIYRHLFAEGIGLRQLMDLYYALRVSSALDRSRAFGILRSLGMKRFAGALMWVMQRVFALEDEFLMCPPGAADGEFLLREVLISGNFGRSDHRYVLNSVGKMRRLLHFVRSYPSEVLWAPVFKLWQIVFIRLPYRALAAVAK